MAHRSTTALTVLSLALLFPPSAGASPSERLPSPSAADDPYLEELLERPTPVVVRPRAPGWGAHPETQLTFGVGWTSITGLTQLSAPSLQANLTLRSRGVSERLGLRLSGFFAIERFGAADESWMDAAAEPAPWAMGVNAAVEISWPGGFYVAPGLGIYHFRGKLERWFAAHEGESAPERLTVPELTLALGWQWQLSRHLALQFNAQAGTALVTLRGSVSAGLVWRL